MLGGLCPQKIYHLMNKNSIRLGLATVAVYLLVTCFLEYHSAQMGAGIALATIFVMPAIVAYLLPTYIATFRNAPRLSSIFLLNLLSGWTFLGWIAALVWACVDIKKNRPQVIVQHIYHQLPPPLDQS